MDNILIKVFCSWIIFAFASCHSPERADNWTEQNQNTLQSIDTPLQAIETSLPPLEGSWQEITESTGIHLDLRYSTANNFAGRVLYPCARCFLRPEVHQAIIEAEMMAQSYGLHIKLYDCYRPLSVQQELWDQFANPNYVTPPEQGSMHNRGLAIDVTLVDSLGQELNMGTGFDDFTFEAHSDYQHPNPVVNDHRQLLNEILTTVGFRGIRTEWWHYSMRLQGYKVSETVWACH